VGARYAPVDPTLPQPWRALIDGNTGNIYYWNPTINITQYDKPLPPGGSVTPPPVVSRPNSQGTSQVCCPGFHPLAALSQACFRSKSQVRSAVLSRNHWFPFALCQWFLFLGKIACLRKKDSM
jgi:hypothetical protein